VHGITGEFLQDKPKFGEIVAEFLDYIRGAELVIQNAAFDVEFLNLELARAGRPPIEECCAGVVDSLALARELHPGKKNSLDAPVRSATRSTTPTARCTPRCSTPRCSRGLLAMTRGQDSLAIELEPARAPSEAWAAQGERARADRRSREVEELAEHARLLAAIEAETSRRAYGAVLRRPWSFAQ